MIENWVARNAKYHDKKRNKLFMTVMLEDVNNYIEEYEHYSNILCIVTFVGGKYECINCAIPNCRGLKSVSLSEYQRELVINSAIDGARKYI